MGTQNIRILYIADDQVVSTWLPVIDGEFAFRGFSSEYTVVNIISQTRELITQGVVRNGERLVITGNLKEQNSIKVAGNSINENYYAFIDKYKGIFNESNSLEIDQEITNYIGRNKGDITSTMLLLNKFSDINNKVIMDSLLALIDLKAKPDNIIDFYMSDINKTALYTDSIADTSAVFLKPFIMLGRNEKVLEFDPTNNGEGYSVIYFWGDDTIGQSRRIYTLNSMLNWHKDKNLQITDISLIQDKNIWQRVVNRDIVPWEHLQAIGAEFNRTIKEMGITNAPTFVVTDTLGMVLYHGNDFNSVSSILDKHLK